MAQSFHTYFGDDATQQFAFTKGYISTSHITALIDGISIAFTWVNPTLIDIGRVLVTGETLVIKRATPRAPLALTDFSNGAALPADDLDRVLLQAMYVAQETDDTADNSILLDTDDKYEANSKIIKNITDGAGAQDAATKGQLDTAILAAGNVPTPDNPADDGKILTASAGSWLWAAAVHTIALISDATAFGKAWLSLADTSAARTNLGLGTAALVNTGLADGGVPVMDATGYPTADGSQITDIAYANINGVPVDTLRSKLVAPVATASGTDIDVTGISADATRITIMFNGVSTDGDSSASPPLEIQIGDNGGLETTGYAGTADFTTGVGSVLSALTGFRVTGAFAAAATIYGIVELILLDASTNTWAFRGVLGYGNSSVIAYTGGTKALTGVLDRFRLTTSTGTAVFDAGSISYIVEE